MTAVAIVGGSGFIGHRLATILRDMGHDVKVVDVTAPTDDSLAYHHADVRDPDALYAALKGSGVVYNLAAVHRDDIQPVTLYDSVNVTGASNVCRACAACDINRLIFVSSVAVYGNVRADASENEPPAPTTAYGKSKLRAEHIHRAWQLEAPRQRSLAIVRPAVVFGEGNRGNVYHLVRLINSGHFLMIGNGRNRKSMAYVGNVSDFLARTLTLTTGAHLFNYVDKPDLSMRELVDTVVCTVGRRRLARIRIPYLLGYLAGLACDLMSNMTGWRLPVSSIRVRKFCSTTTFSARRLRSTGFRPAVGLKDALQKTIRRDFLTNATRAIPARERGR